MFLITISIFQAVKRLSWKEGILSILPAEYFLPWIKQLTCDRDCQHTNEACCPIRLITLDPRLMQVLHAGSYTVFFKTPFPHVSYWPAAITALYLTWWGFMPPPQKPWFYTHAHTNPSAQKHLSWCAWCSHPMVLQDEFPGQQCLCKTHFVTAHFSVTAALV